MSDDSVDVYVTKGTRVLVDHMEAYLCGLAGAQMKTGMRRQEFTGTVRHIRGDGPTQEQCKQIHFWIEPDENPDNIGEKCKTCKVYEVRVPRSAIKAVLKDREEDEGGTAA